MGNRFGGAPRDAAALLPYWPCSSSRWSGALVLSPSYIAFLGMREDTATGGGTFEGRRALGKSSPSSGALATFASPYLSVLQLYNPKLWDITDVTLSSIYLGASIPILGLSGLSGTTEISLALVGVAGVGVFFLLSAMGKYVPIRGWLYDFVPPTRYFFALHLCFECTQCFR